MSYVVSSTMSSEGIITSLPYIPQQVLHWLQDQNSLLYDSRKLLLGASIIVLPSVYFLYRSRRRVTPPGPRGWRGTLDIVRASRNNMLYEAAWTWAERYGELTYYSILGQSVCIVNSADMFRKLFQSEEYKLLTADREATVVSDLALPKNFSFSHYDHVTRQKRHMFHKVLAAHGTGVEAFEDVVAKELDRLMTEIDGFGGNADVPMTHVLARSLKSILYILVNGDVPENISYETVDVLERFDMAFNDMMEPGTLAALTYFPVLKKFGKYKRMCENMLESKKAAEEVLFKTIKSSYTPGVVRGTADALFQLQKQPGYEWFDDDHLNDLLIEIFCAANITSRSTLLNLFLILTHRPDVQVRIQEELETVLGDRRPSVNDRPHLPYTESVILETLRLVTPAPLVPRSAREDIHVDGLVIPRGTMLLHNPWFMHHDPSIWDGPWDFNPERFLDPKGQLLPATEPARKNLQAFGIGARACPGEVFAKSRVFLLVTTILQNYDLLKPEATPLPSCDPRDNNVPGLIRQAPPFSCRLRRRVLTSEEHVPERRWEF